MSSEPALKGVLAPVITPSTRSLARWPIAWLRNAGMLTQGSGACDFGTQQRSASLSVNERIALLDALLAADIDPSRMMPGPDAAR